MGKRALETLTESMFYVLMSFLGGARCGTDVAAWVLQRTQGRVKLGPGTLYAILPKFEEEGLIREVAVEGRKRTYALTDKGRALYREELERLRRCYILETDSRYGMVPFCAYNLTGQKGKTLYR